MNNSTALNMLPNSRLNFLMTTNTAPSRAEAYHVQHYIVRQDSVISELDGQILQASSHLARLTQQRAEKQRHLDRLKSVVSPARRLPADLWARIFKFCQSQHDRKSLPHPHHPPLIFGRICSRWRKICLTTPVLWKHLYLDLSDTTNVAHLADLMKIWISFAHPLFLDVAMKCTHVTRPADLFQSTLIPYARQLQTLNLTVTFEQFEPLLCIPDGMPALEVLKLNCTSESIVSSGELPNLHTWKAPCLRTVDLKLRSFQNFLISDLMNLPWSKLSELRLEGLGFYASDVVKLISLATNLRQLYIFADSWDNRPGAKTTTFYRHIKLDTLTLHFSSGSNLKDRLSLFIGALTLPALKHLEINTDALTSLFFLQHRSMFELKTLSVNFDVHPGALLSFLPCVPSLVKLSLYCNGQKEGSDTGFLKALHYETTEPYLLVPLLEELSFNICGALDTQKLVNLIRSRWWIGPEFLYPGVTRLKKVTLLGLNSQSLSVLELEHLHEFRREGLVMDIS